MVIEKMLQAMINKMRTQKKCCCWLVKKEYLRGEKWVKELMLRLIEIDLVSQAILKDRMIK